MKKTAFRIPQGIECRARWAALCIGGMLVAGAVAKPADSGELFEVAPVPADPAAWTVNVSSGKVPNLVNGELGAGVRVVIDRPEQPFLLTLKLKKPVPVLKTARRVGVWIYADSRFWEGSRGAPLRFLLRDATGIHYSNAQYGSQMVPGAWNYVECPRLRGGEFQRLDETMIRVEGGLQHHLPVAPVSFVGLEFQVRNSIYLPKQIHIELGDVCGDGIHREDSAFYWQCDLGERYLFGEMPFARQPFVTAGDLLPLKGDYAVAWQARKALYGRPVAQGEWKLPGYDAGTRARFQRLDMPLAAQGQYWVTFKVVDTRTNAPAPPRFVETRVKVIRGSSAEPAPLKPEMRPVGTLLVVNPQRAGHVYAPGELPRCVVRVWRPDVDPAPAGSNALTLLLTRTLYPQGVLGQDEAYPAVFAGSAQGYVDISVPLALTETQSMIRLDLRLMDGKREVDRAAQWVGQQSLPDVSPWTNRDKVLRWADIFEDGNHLLSCAEWDPRYPQNTDLAQFEAWVLDVKRQNVNTIELFPKWGDIEPMPGVFWWDQVDRRLAVIAKHGLKAMINLDSTYVPAWLVEESQADEEGMVNGLWHGGGNAVLKSPNSEQLRRYYGEYLTHLALRYRNDPNLVAYSSLIIFFDHFWADHPWVGHYVDYSESARRGFRGYLRDVRGLSLEDVSKRWGKTLASWDEVELPRTDLFLGLATIDRPDPRPEWRDFVAFRQWCEQDFLVGGVAGVVRQYDDLRPIGFHRWLGESAYTSTSGLYVCAGGSEGSLEGYRKPSFGSVPKRAESIAMLFHSPYYTAMSMANLLAQGNSLNVQHFWQPSWRWDEAKGPGEQAVAGTHALAGWLALFQGELGRAVPVHAGDGGPKPVLGLLFSRASILYGVRSFHFPRLDDYKMILQRACDAPKVVLEEDVSAEELARLPCVIVDQTTRILPKDTVERLAAYVRAGGKLVLTPTGGRYTLDPADGDHVLRRALGVPLPKSKWRMAEECRQPGDYTPYYPWDIAGRGTPGEQSLSEPGQTAVATAAGGGVFPADRKLVFRLGPYSMYNRDTWGDWSHMLPYFIFGRYQERTSSSGTALATWTDGGAAATLHAVGKGQVLCLWGTPDWYNWRTALGDIAQWAGPAKDTATGTPQAPAYTVGPEGFKGYILALNGIRWAVIRNETTGWTGYYNTTVQKQKEAPRMRGAIKLASLPAAQYRVQDLTPLLAQGYDQTLTREQLAQDGIAVNLIPSETRIFRLDPVPPQTQGPK